ncbi:MAG TPA: class E sortase [Rubrobacter sp.]
MAATFFVGAPPDGAEAEVASVDKVSSQPDVPVAAGKIDRAIERQNREATVKVPPKEDAGSRLVERVVPRGPESKVLRLTVPKMSQIRNDTVPYSVSDDKKAFHDHAAVHLRGTGNPWDRQANVYIAGHRLGFPGTDSWLSFWDLDVLGKGDRIYIKDAAGDRYVYKVFKKFIVGPNEVSVTRPLRGKNIVSLQTCTLPDYSERLIVQAEKVARG